MEGIYDPNDTFDFDKLLLTKPVAITGGNYFIKTLIHSNPLYIQPPMCKLKQGISKASKKLFTDLMFTNENDKFIQWMENLENHIQKYIYKNREQWFDGDLEMTDIENYFTPPMKIYKSGKYYIIRTNITTMLGKSVLKIYDENENEVDMDNINENMNIMTILEIQGIKCSARSFQIEIELKQMLVMNPVNIFDKCLLTKKSSVVTPPLPIENNTEVSVSNEEPCSNDVNDISCETKEEASYKQEEQHSDTIEHIEQTEAILECDNTTTQSEVFMEEKNGLDNESEHPEHIDETKNEHEPENETKNIKINNGLEEVDFNLEQLPETETIQIKQRNEVYYEMYREARRKAKIARNLALSSYLEAKRIKNTYMLEDIKDSDDDSDLDMDDEDENEEQKQENTINE